MEGDPFTARADAPRLELTSRHMIHALEQEKGKRSGGLLRASPRSRVLWLTRFFNTPLAPRVRLARVLGALVVAGALALVVGRSISTAVAYHPTWLSRMRSHAASHPGDSAR
jgi:hypothetical protein